VVSAIAREGNLHRHRRRRCRRNRRDFNARDAVRLDFRMHAIDATVDEEAKRREESLQ